MELKNFRGTFADWNSVPDINEESGYKSVDGSKIPQIGDYILVRDAKNYPYKVVVGQESISSTVTVDGLTKPNEELIGRVLAQDVNYLDPIIPAGTLVTYNDCIKIGKVTEDILLYTNLSWRFVLDKAWEASEFDPTRTYFVNEVIYYGDTYMRYTGIERNPWEKIDYIPGKAQWVPYEEVDDSTFATLAYETQVKSNAKGLQRALENLSNIFWGSMNLTDSAINQIVAGSTYNVRNLDDLSCHEGDTLWVNVTNSDTGAFGQLYLTALQDATAADEIVRTKVRSFVWSGLDGAVWFSGEGVPNSDTAPGSKDGDMYLDTISGFVYSKSDGAWAKKSEMRGKDGASFSHIEEHYLASEYDTGITIDNPNWDKKTPIDYTEISYARPYLWNYETIYKIVNGVTTPEDTTPRVVGTYGGKGVSLIQDFYILTADELYVPSKTDDDWDTDPPTITPLLKCLWNYTRITYTDGTRYESPMTVIGRFGDQGKSAFDIAVEEGYVGSKSQWLASLQGSDGDRWYNGEDAPLASVGTEGDWYLDTKSGDFYNRFKVETYATISEVPVPPDFHTLYLVEDVNNKYYRYVEDDSVLGYRRIEYERSPGASVNPWVFDGNINGADGDKWFSGNGIPSDDEHESREGYYYVAGTKQGDYYLNVANGDVYHKGVSGWGSAVGNIKGPTGGTGANGMSEYIHIMYSPNPNAQQVEMRDAEHRLSTDVWMGVAITSVEASENAVAPEAPSNPASYTWSKVVGDDAAQLNLLGDWWPNTEYIHSDSQIDVVYVDDPVYTKGTYACTHTHTSGSVFVRTNWTLMAADGTDGQNGQDGMLMVLSNENCSVPSEADGSNPLITANTSTTAYLYKGGVSVVATYAVSNHSLGIGLTQNGDTFTVNRLDNDTEFADITATYTEGSTTKTFTKRFVVTKMKQGLEGENATSYWIDKSVNIIKKDVNASPVTYTPNAVTFTAMKQVGTSTPTAFDGILRLYLNGDSIEDDHGTRTLGFTPTSNDTYCTVKLYADASSNVVLDTESVSVIECGQNGTNGRGVSSTDDYYLSNNDDTTVPDVDDQAWTTFASAKVGVGPDKRFIWNMEVINYTTGNSDKLTPHIVYRYAENGRGVFGIEESYAFGDASSPSSAVDAWGSSPKTPSDTNGQRYVWQKERVEYDEDDPNNPNSWASASGTAEDGVVYYTRSGSGTEASPYVYTECDPQPSVGASVSTLYVATGYAHIFGAWSQPHILSMYLKGADGRGISSTSEEYAVNNDDTTPPTDPDPLPSGTSSVWKSTFAEVASSVGPNNRYIWNRETINYSGGGTDPLQAHVIYRYSEDGRTLSEIEEYYAYGDASGPFAATWGNKNEPKVPSATANQQYVWQKEKPKFDDGTYATETTPHLIAMWIKGDKGEDAQIFEMSVSSPTYVRDERLSGDNQPITIFVTRQGYPSADGYSLNIQAYWMTGDPNVDPDSNLEINLTSVIANEQYSMSIPYTSVYDKIMIIGQIIKTENNTSTVIKEIELWLEAIDKTETEKFFGYITDSNDVPSSHLLEGDWYIAGYDVSDGKPKGSVLEYQYIIDSVSPPTGHYSWELMEENAANGDKFLSALSILKEQCGDLSELSSSNGVSWFSTIVADSLFANQITMSSQGTIQSSNYEYDDVNEVPTAGFKLTSSDGTASFVDAHLYNANVEGLVAEGADITDLNVIDIDVTGGNIENINIKYADITNATATSLKVTDGEFNGTIDHESLTTYATVKGNSLTKNFSADADLWCTTTFYNSSALDKSAEYKGYENTGFKAAEYNSNYNIYYNNHTFDRFAAQNGTRTGKVTGGESGISVGNNSTKTIKSGTIGSLLGLSSYGTYTKVYLIFKARLDGNYTMPYYFYIANNGGSEYLVKSGTATKDSSEKTLFSGFVNLSTFIRFKAHNNNWFQTAHVSYSWEIYKEWDFRPTWYASEFRNVSANSGSASSGDDDPQVVSYFDIITPSFGDRLVLTCPKKDGCSIGIYNSNGTTLLANCSSTSVTYNCSPGTTYRIKVTRPLIVEDDGEGRLTYSYGAVTCNGIFLYVYDSGTANKKGIIMWNTSDNVSQYIPYYDSDSYLSWINNPSAPPRKNNSSGAEVTTFDRKVSGTKIYDALRNAKTNPGNEIIIPNDGTNVYIDDTQTRTIGSYTTVAAVRLVPSRGVEFQLDGTTTWVRLTCYGVEGSNGTVLEKHGVYDASKLNYTFTTLASQVRVEVTNIYPKEPNSYSLGSDDDNFIAAYVGKWRIEGVNNDLVFTYHS